MRLMPRLALIFTLVAMAPFSATAASVTLAWEASPSPGTIYYKLHMGEAPGAYMKSVDIGTGLTYTFTDLLPNRTYYFAASAYDATGNMSPMSNEVMAKIPGLPVTDTTKPTIPRPLTGTRCAPAVTLTWPAAADTSGIAEYHIQRCSAINCTNFSTLAQTPLLTYTDSALSPGITYRYRLRAKDTAGNLSLWSNSITVKACA